MILISAKYNHKCTEEIYLLSSNRFCKVVLNDIPFKKNFVKNENWFIWFKTSQTHVSTISFAYFEAFFLKIPMLKNFLLQRRYFTQLKRVLPRHYKNYALFSYCCIKHSSNLKTIQLKIISKRCNQTPFFIAG